VRLSRQFSYLAAVLDVFSRRCIGSSIREHLRSSLAIAALEMAFSQREVKSGLLHHSDRGSQYASGDYIKALDQHGIQPSMSAKGNPYDNANAEGFMKTLKYEEVYLWEYENAEEAQASIGWFIEKIYNRRRLHSALGYRSPADFKRSLTNKQSFTVA